MKKLLISFFSVLSLLVISASPAMALDFASGDNIIISENVLDDLYLLAGNASVDANVNGDLHIAGGSVTVNGNVSGDLIVAGGRVTVMGNVSGDLRAMGGQLAIYGNVAEDLILLGGQVDIGKNSNVGGTVLTGSGSLSVDGNVGKDIRGAVGILLLNGKVGGDVILTVQNSLVISDNAIIEGNLDYSAILEADIPPSVIRGSYNFNQFDAKKEVVKFTSLFVLLKFLSYLSALLLAVLLIFISPKVLIRSAEITKENVFKSFSVGLLTIIISMIGSMILMITIVGIPIAVIVFAALLVASYLSKVFVSVWLASYVFNVSSKKKKAGRLKLNLFIAIAVTLFAYFVVVMIPIVGWIINIILFFVGIGSIVLLNKEHCDFLKAKKVI